ncbi:hypothetical protein [Ureibacillus acetophenoni]|uniref:Uncharacterized protein n=1 Tax=Ureibacillus acetophenoni TaxID=614649 RepID=A0A285UBP7_9BACL|nr:hypothetical protein [Ureibacillus acetophenoni]SOC39252.1 hypothetical protein SAMN05877842_105126 [Ureibacillus acetophenoni]
MNQHYREELSLVFQALLGILLTAIFAHVMFLTQSVFPWYSVFVFGIILAIVAYLLFRKRVIPFISFTILFTFVYSIAYNFGVLFPLHS